MGGRKYLLGSCGGEGSGIKLGGGKASGGYIRKRGLSGELARAGYGVVAFAREDGEAFAANTDFDGVIVLGFIVAAGIVAQRVLIAGLFGDAGVETFQRIAFGGIEHVAAGIVGIGLKAREFAFIEAAADSETVDGNAITKKFFHSVAISVVIGFAIFAVRDQENHLAAVAAAIF